MSGAPAPASWSEIAVWRREQRRAIQAARQALSATAYREKCRAVEQHLAPLLPALETTLLGIYWPIRLEFDPLPIARRLVAKGGAVALPMVVGKGRPLEFRRWTPDSRMEKGVYDIPYPAEGPGVTPTAFLVPLLGFDGAGYRLGYGAGYYDRTLGAYSALPLRIGVGFELGRLATIYPQPHDIPMTELVTEAGRFPRQD